MKNLTKLNLKKLRLFREAFMHQWMKHYKLFYFFGFVIVLAVGVVQWHWHVRSYAWTDEEKQAYIKRTVQETTLQEKKYRETLKSLDELQRAHEGPSPLTRDIFLGKKVTE